LQKIEHGQQKKMAANAHYVSSWELRAFDSRAKGGLELEGVRISPKK
jgi:hypothetical protein